ncbi:hypothetical protein IWW48_005219 [Coemansia sp. RSA 1200]|nr:hypothetical protein IWW48_005219 [Coemansia sp. RSA 1200]
MEKFRVSHQLVSLDFNFDKRVIKGVTELSVEPKSQDLTTIQLHCERPVIRSASIDGYPCEFKHNTPATRHELLKKTLRIQSDESDGELVISLPPQVQITPIEDDNDSAAATAAAAREPTFKGLRVRIEFYMVNPTCGIVFNSGTDNQTTTAHTETKVYPSTTRTWVPCVDSMRARCTWDLFFSVPACVGLSSLDDPAASLLPLVVVSAGELSSLVVHPHDPARRIFRYIMSTATPACTLGFAIGPFTSACTLDGSQLLVGSDGGSSGKQNGGASETEAQADADAEKSTASEGRDAQVPAPAPEADSEAEPAAAAAKASHSAMVLRKATVDAIGGVFAFASGSGHQDDLENTCGFIPEALAFHSQEFGSYPYATYKVVFMDGLREPVITCASLTIASTDLLHPRTVIEQVYDTRRTLGLAVAQQWFGTYIVPESWSDYWLVSGLAGYVAGMFVRHNLGANEHRYRLKRDMERLCHADVNQRPVSYPRQAPVVRQDEVEFVQLKAPIILYMLDRRMMKGGMSLGLHRIVPKVLVAAMSGDLGHSNAVATAWFLRMSRKVSGVDVKKFADQWIFGTGCPVFHFSYAFNRKKLAVEITMHQESTNAKATAPWVRPRQLFSGQMTARIREADGTPYEHVLDIHERWKKFEVQFNTKYKRIRRSTKRFHMRQMAAAAEELNVNAEVLGIEDDDEYGSSIALFGAESAQAKRDWRVVEWGEDDEESLASATFEWIRIDSDLEWACIIHFAQPDFMWAAQLQKDRDVAAQLEAVDALQHVPSAAASTTLMRTVMDARVFYRVRVDAALALERFARPALGWIGLHHLVKIYKNRYCLPPANGSDSIGSEGTGDGDGEDIEVPRLPRPNNFTNIGEYFTQKAVLAALSNIRDQHGEAPLAARRLMAGALRYNDNSENVYSDSFFLATLVRALANSVVHSTRFARTYSLGAAPRADEDAVLGEIERLRKVDALAPSFHNVVTRACLEALLRLSLVQPRAQLFNTALFASMAAADAYVAVRETAVGGLMLHWGLGGDAAAARLFVAVASDSRGEPRLAAVVSRNLVQLAMVRAMVFGQQHRSLLFMEEKGSEATEHIDTDARLVGGLEALIDALPDSRTLQTMVASAVYDATLPQSAHVLLGALAMLVYQVADCSIPPRAPKTRKKLKIKLGGRQKPRHGSQPMPSAKSTGSSDSEDMPLALAMVGGGDPYADPFSAAVVPGEFASGSSSARPLASVADAEGGADFFGAGKRKWHPEPPAAAAATDAAIGSGLPPPQINTSTTPSVHGDQAPPRVKLKLKLSAKPPSTPTPTAAPTSTASRATHFSPTLSPPVHSTAPRVSSPLATAHAASPGAWSPAYNPPDVSTDFEQPVPVVAEASAAIAKPKRPKALPAAPAPTAPAAPDDSSLQKRLSRVLRKISRHASAFPFMRPVDVELDGCPTYYTVIQHPMDLSTIKRRLDSSSSSSSSSGGYASADEFEADVRLMLSNCFTFNPPGTPVYLLGKDIEAVFDAEWTKSATAADSAPSKTSKRKPSVSPLESEKVGNEKAGGEKTGTPKKRSRKSAAAAATAATSSSLAVSGSLDDPEAIIEYLDKTEKKEKDREERPLATSATATGTASASSARKRKPAPQKQQQHQHSSNPAAAPSSDWKATSSRILLRLQAQPSALEFLAPVDPVNQGVPTYAVIVKSPMDLGTVRKNLDRNQYRSIADFRRDVELVFSNCFLFNGAGTFVYTQGETLQRFFRHLWTQHVDSPPATVIDTSDGDAPFAPAHAEILLRDSPDAEAAARTVLGKLKRDTSAWPFLKPVDPVALGIPTYFDIVKNPMDLSTVQKKLAKKTYVWAADFVADIQLIVDDCFLFNPPDTPVNDCGKALQKAARELLEPYGWALWLAPL